MAILNSVLWNKEKYADSDLIDGSQETFQEHWWEHQGCIYFPTTAFLVIFPHASGLQCGYGVTLNIKKNFI